MFKPTLARSILLELASSLGKRIESCDVLDFSAGWGDRLIGALSCPVRSYTATDPNVSLKEGHGKIIEELGAQKKLGKISPDLSLYRIIYEPFQTANLPSEPSFDIIFSSPPYFNFEVCLDWIF